MGTSTFVEFSTKMDRLGGLIPPTSKKIVDRSAFTVKKAVQAQLAVAAPRGRLNVGKRGSRIGVRYRLHENSAVVAMFGPAQLIERDTKPHRIPRATVGRRRRANRKPINIPGIGWRQYANHPGTKGKHPWEKGLRLARPLLPKVGGQLYVESVRKALR